MAIATRRRQLGAGRSIAASALLAVLALSAAAAAEQAPARPSDYIVDLAGVLDAGTRSKLNGYLHELEQKTGAQLLVLTVNTTDGVPIEDYALKVAEKWRLGKKGQDNGLLVVVAVRDRKYRIEVGYGLEPVIPDSFAGRVGREAFVPHFRRNQYGAGINAGVLMLAGQIAKSSGVAISGMPQPTPAARSGRGRNPAPAVFFVFLAVLILFGILRSARRRRHGHWGGDGLWSTLLVLDALSRSRGRSSGGWGGWGGFGGGGGGSFGGGGGGSFGGGGASGGW